MIFRNRRNQEIGRQARTSRRRRLANIISRTPRLESLKARHLLTAYVIDLATDVVDDSDGKLSLREAIIAANTNAAFSDAPAGMDDGDSITFDAALAGSTITLANGELSITDDLTIDGSAGGSTRITLDADNASRVFFIDTSAAAGTSSDVGLSNLIATNGNALVGFGGAINVVDSSTVSLSNVDITSSSASRGGGLYAESSLISISGGAISNNVVTSGGGGQGEGGAISSVSNSSVNISAGTIIENNTAVRGGGIYVGSNASVTVVGSTIRSNTATDSGGGIYVDGSGGNRGTANISGGSTINDNSATNNGGGIANIGNLTINGATIGAAGLGNTAGMDGGGLYLGASSGTNSISNVTIGNNTASGAGSTNGGGGIFVGNGKSLSLGGTVTIANNVADGASGSGGGIFVSSSAALIANGTVITGNRANRAGGGIEDNSGSGLGVTLTNVTLSNNVAGPAGTANPGNGGGLHVTGSGNVTISGGTISGNSAASEGGGLWNGGGTMTINGASITGNTAGDGGAIFNNGGTVNIGQTSSVTITGNVADGASGSGGGIFNNTGGTITVTNSNLSGNTANRAGGGIEDASGAGLGITLNNVTLNNNVAGPSGSANPGNGGGLHVSGDGNVLVTGGTIDGNRAAREGGGLWNGTGTMTIDGTTISGNTASGDAIDDGGGGVFNDRGIVNISNAMITGNAADGAAGSGGGILNLEGSISITSSLLSLNTAKRAGGGIEDNAGMMVTVTDSTIQGNNAGNAPGNGGGVHITGAGNVAIVTSTIAGNTAKEGGGLWNSTTGTMTIENSTLSGNSAGGSDGGGLFNSNGGTVNIDSATITLNSASTGIGSGIAAGTGGVTMTNTIVAQNPGMGTEQNLSGSIASEDFNLVGDANDGVLTGPIVNTIFAADALLLPLANNGGPTETHLPAAGSPAIGFGSTDLMTDQRGEDRPQGSQDDIGAVEVKLSGVIVDAGGGIGDGLDDEFLIINDDQGITGNILVYVNTLLEFVFPKATTGQILVRGSTDDDTLTVDNSNGLIGATMIFDGDGSSQVPNAESPVAPGGLDMLRLIGSTPTTTTYNPGSTVDAGAVYQENDEIVQRVQFFGLEPIQVVGTGGGDTLNVASTPLGIGFPQAFNGNNTINYSEGPNSGDELDPIFAGKTTGLITVDGFESLEFSNFETLNIDAGAGSDFVQLNHPTNPNELVTINVAGGDPTAGSDSVVVNGTPASNMIDIDQLTLDGARVVGAQGAEVNVTGAESLLINGQGGLDLLTVTTPSGDDLIGYTPGDFPDAGSIAIQDLPGPERLLPLSFRDLGIVGGSVNFKDADDQRADVLVVTASNNNDAVNVAANGEVTIRNSANAPITPAINTTGIAQLVLQGLDGDDSFEIPGNHPFSNTVGIVIEGGNPDSGSDVLNFVGSGSGNVTLDLAAQSITEDGFTSVSFAGVEHVNIDANAELTVTGTDENDTFDVTPTGAGNDGNLLHSGSAADFHYTNATVFTVEGAGGDADQLNVHGNDFANIITTTADSITVDGSTVTLGSGLEAIQLFAEGGDDDVDVSDLAFAGVTTILGGDGNDSIVVSSQVDHVFGGAGNDVLDFVGSGAGNVTLDLTEQSITEDGFTSVSFAEVEHVNIDANAELTVTGTDENDTFDVTPTGAGNDGNLLHSGSAAEFRYTNATVFTVVGAGGDADQLNVHGNNADNTITTTADSIIVDGSTVTLGSGLEAIQLFAKGGDDDVDFSGLLYSFSAGITILGGDGDDLIVGTDQADHIFGGAGNDTLMGGGENDVQYGEAGNDMLIGGDGDDVQYGGDGDDTLMGGGGNDVQYGEAGNDILIGGGGDDVQYGGDGNDVFGNSTLTPDGTADDPGADQNFGGSGFDNFIWEPGDGEDVNVGGDDGGDIFRFFGNAAANTFTLRSNEDTPTHLSAVFNNAVVIDNSGIEDVIVDPQGDNDAIDVQDLYATEVASVTINAAGGDETITVAGRATADDLAVTAPFETRVEVLGLTYDINILGPSTDDDLTINTGDGNDSINVAEGVEAILNTSLLGGAGNDSLSGNFNSADGGAGDDLLQGGSTNSTMMGGAGNDTIIGGDGDETIEAGPGEDTIIGGGGADSIDGGDDFDTILIQGTSGADVIDVFQAAPNELRYTVNGDTEVDELTAGSVEEAHILAGAGADLIRVNWLDAHVDNGAIDALQMTVDGGSDSTSDRLVVVDDGEDDLVLYRKGQADGSGTVEIGPANPERFTNGESLLSVFNGIETINFVDEAGAPIVNDPNGPQLVVFKHDPFETNDDRFIATYLGGGATINVDPTIDPGALINPFGDGFDLPGDRDYYRLVATKTGTLDFQVYFRQVGDLVSSGRPGLPGDGDLDIHVLDSQGNLITGFGENDDTDDERVRIPAVAGQTYYLEVIGKADAINVYSLSFINDAPPVPYALELDDNPINGETNPPGMQEDTSDTGRSQFDNHTYDNTPTIYFRLDDGIFLNDLPGNGDNTPGNPPDQKIEIPFRAGVGLDLEQPTQPGYAIAIFDEGSTPDQEGTAPQVPLGFATQVVIDGVVQQGVYEFTVPEDSEGNGLSEGSHFLTARVQMIDPSMPQQTGFGGRSLPLEIVVDTIAPDVAFGLKGFDGDGLLPESDSGNVADGITNDLTPSFFGRAEANAIVRAYLYLGEGVTPLLIGQTVATPYDGTEQLETPLYPNEPGGQWEMTSTVSMNDPRVVDALGLDGLRRMFVTAEDVAGNISAADDEILEIFIDTQGPQVDDVFITGREDFNLFSLKPETPEPTPKVESLTIRIVDLPERIAPFFYPAVANVPPLAPIVLVGDHSGVIAIESIEYQNIRPGDDPDNPIEGIAEGNIILTFAEPLPDDRYTLTLSDNIVDPAGNQLDGENNAVEPVGDPDFPTGDGIPGGDFIARFTVDSRPEIAVWSQGVVYADINGNFVWDPEGQDNDATNRDFVFNFGEITDAYFTGNFASNYLPGVDGKLGTMDDVLIDRDDVVSSGFDKLGAYGAFNGQYQFFLDTNDDGVGDTVGAMYYQVNAIPVAGNFFYSEADEIAQDQDPERRPRDEIGAFDGQNWYLDINGNNKIDSNEKFPTSLRGIPVVGDFNGDGVDDLGTYNNATGEFTVQYVSDYIQNVGPILVNSTPYVLNFGFSGFGERPVVGDVNLDGIDDFVMWVPRQEGQLPKEAGEFHFLVSDNPPGENQYPPLVQIFNPYSPEPLGNDLVAQFGDDFALPLLGNFDPPVDGGSSGTPFFGSLTNELNPLDTNADGSVTALDALVVINAVARGVTVEPNANPLRFVASIGGYRLDSSQDGIISTLDALRVINGLALERSVAQSESITASADNWASRADQVMNDLDDEDDDLIDLLALASSQIF